MISVEHPDKCRRAEFSSLSVNLFDMFPSVRVALSIPGKNDLSRNCLSMTGGLASIRGKMKSCGASVSIMPRGQMKWKPDINLRSRGVITSHILSLFLANAFGNGFPFFSESVFIRPISEYRDPFLNLFVWKSCRSTPAGGSK